MTSPDLLSGSTLRTAGAQYRVVQRLGDGANCRVYLVFASKGPYQGIVFAAKVFLKIDDAARLRRFELERAFLLATDHPCVMKVYDYGSVRIKHRSQYREFPFVVAEYFSGTLDDANSHRPRLAERVLCMMQLLSALRFLGSSTPAVVHRDIKPKNIFVRGNRSALGDFGLMKRVVDADAEGLSNDGDEVLAASTGPGMPRSYRTPDLVSYAHGQAAITPSSDVFQLGLVGAEMFCGKNPLKQAANRMDPIDMEELARVPGSQGPAIMDALSRMLELNPELRATVDSMLEQWESIFLTVVSAHHQLEERVL